MESQGTDEIVRYRGVLLYKYSYSNRYYTGIPVDMVPSRKYMPKNTLAPSVPDLLKYMNDMGHSVVNKWFAKYAFKYIVFILPTLGHRTSHPTTYSQHPPRP